MTEDYTYQRCTVEQWEKKAELALMNGDMGEAMKYAHYANLRDSDTSAEEDISEEVGDDAC